MAFSAHAPDRLCGQRQLVPDLRCETRPRDGHERLYHAPCPNIHHHGGICSGNTTFLVCSPHTIEVALSLFMENSLFNGDLRRGKCRRYPDDVRQLWAVLEGKSRFPLSELVSCRRVLRDLL